MIVDLDTVKLQLRVDFGDEDVTIERKIAAAQNLIERHLGYKIEDQFGGVDQDEIPASLLAIGSKTAKLCSLASMRKNCQ
jgi:hypothetical protein